MTDIGVYDCFKEFCGLFFECETVHKTRVVDESLDAEVRRRYYASGDFHTIYNGRVLHSYRR
jgi:hypothetical protein